MGVFIPREQVWLGGHYVLSMQFAGKRLPALSRLWDHSSLLGCYLRSDIEPSEQVRVSIEEQNVQSSLYGIATLPNGGNVACGTASSTAEEPFWIDFFVPLSSLRGTYPVGGYPYNCGDDYDDHWLTEIDDWLIAMAKFVFEDKPFEIAVVGFEPRLGQYAQVTMANVPVRRSETILVPNRDQLQVFSRTTGR